MIQLQVMFPDMEKDVFYPAQVEILDGRIHSIRKLGGEAAQSKLTYMVPGFVDAHIHIESSMLCPSRFAEIAVRHGTVATVSDPHEIANVLGIEGIRFMQEDAKKVPLKIFYTVPSCVPATDFEESGARLGAADVDNLLQDDGMVALGEMMNFPGVIGGDAEVHKKIKAAIRRGKPIDGHAPGLAGSDLEKYTSAGITTDHEAVSLEEAREKIALGLKILIREGSAAKNFEALKPLIIEYNDMVMLCSDDLHPDDLLKGHINLLMKSGLEFGASVFDMIRVSSTNPIAHYRLNVGQLREGDPADFLLIDSPEKYSILSTWIAGEKVFDEGKTLFNVDSKETPNTFITKAREEEDFRFKGESGKYRVIDAIDGSLLTRQSEESLVAREGVVQGKREKDVLKIAVVNRYKEAMPSVAWIRNFGFSRGAIASSVAHDSHNIVAVGCTDKDITAAVNALIESGGGISLWDGDKKMVLPLPIGGIMSNAYVEDVANAYAELTILAKDLGSKLAAPFMTLSFMALLVIPDIKIGDKGLFDVVNFKFTSSRIDRH